MAAKTTNMDSENPEKALDLNVALAHVDGDLELLSELASIFLQDYPRLMEDARRAILQSDYSGLERAAHTLKGRLAFFGIAKHRDRLSGLEEMGRDEDLTGAEDALTELERNMGSLLSEFEALIRR